MSLQEQKTVLIIDENPLHMTMLSGRLRGSGFETLFVESGAKALPKAKQAAPDIILLDVLLPDMDGFEVCRALKTDPTTKNIPVIFISALTSPADKIKGFKLGAVDYLTKPLQAEERL